MQVGVSPAREATFSTLGGFSVKCFPRVLPYVVPGVATGVASGVAPGVARAVGQTKKSEKVGFVELCCLFAILGQNLTWRPLFERKMIEKLAASKTVFLGNFSF